MLVPVDVQSLLKTLNDAGFSAYAVGGCVRDSLLGRTPSDWDICTSATPEEMKAIFREERLVETGLKHGTLTVVRNHIPYEITTFREDGNYADHRHPDTVSFVRELSGDLARRDFTINAMACASDGQVIDLYQGREDLSRGVIRCVGTPSQRFEEDALRILRALRFASTMDFLVDPDTEQAVRLHYPELTHVAAERIRVELFKLLCGPGAGRVLRSYTEVFAFLIPALAPSVDYHQQNPHHRYTVWEHTIRGLEGVPPDLALRLTMLFHDTGKPYTRTTDENGIGHYRGHPAVSAQLAHQSLLDLRCDRQLMDRVVRLVEAHDIPLSTDRKLLLHRLNKFGERDLRALFQIHQADRIATGTRNPDHARKHCVELNAALDQLLSEQPCYSLRDLAVNGDDLKELGYAGKEIGATLNRLLEAVMNGDLPNEKEALLDSLRVHD